MLMERLLAPYSFGFLQDAVSFFHLLERENVSIETVNEFVASQKKAVADRLEGAKKCPACGGLMGHAPVNTGPRDQTGDDSTFVWICSQCGHEEWTNKPLRRIVHEVHGGRAPGARASDCTGRRSPFDALPRPKCPQCGLPMRIGSVNSCAATRIGGGYKSVWYCPAVRECGHCEYSPRTVGQWRRELEAKKGGRHG